MIYTNTRQCTYRKNKCTHDSQAPPPHCAYTKNKYKYKYSNDSQAPPLPCTYWKQTNESQAAPPSHKRVFFIHPFYSFLCQYHARCCAVLHVYIPTRCCAIIRMYVRVYVFTWGAVLFCITGCSGVIHVCIHARCCSVMQVWRKLLWCSTCIHSYQKLRNSNNFFRK